MRGWEEQEDVFVKGGCLGSECDCLAHSVSQFPERPSSWYGDVLKESDFCLITDITKSLMI